MKWQFSSLYFASLSDYLQTIKHFDQSAMQVSDGQYNASSETMSFPMFDLMRVSMECRTIYHGMGEKGYIYIVIPEGNINIHVNGYEISYNELYVLSPEEELLATFPEHFTGYYLSIKKEILGSLIGGDSVNHLLKNASFIRSGEIVLPYLSSFKAQLIGNIKFSMEKRQYFSKIIAGDIQDNILSSLANLFSKSELDVSWEPKYNKRYEIMKRALAYIDNSGKTMITVAELARSTFCSLRTLQYAFEKTVGLSPKQYLIFRRMNFIRNEFQKGDLSGVGKGLLEYGVVNFGRFSQDYNSLFGEFPKETLKFARSKSLL